MPASILDLPTELILKIIHSDDSTDASYATIAYLGMTCRRLHDICQVLVLERQLPLLRALANRGRLLIYRNPGSIAMKDEELYDVKEIFQASFHRIKYIPVIFTGEEIASVHGLIFHANAVGHIDVNLDLLPYILGLSEKKDWYKPLASLIRVSSEKDMASLSITGSPVRERNFKPRLPTVLKTPSSPVQNYFSIFSRLNDRFFGHKTRSGGKVGTQPNHQEAGVPERERLPNSGVYFGAPRGLTSFEIHSLLPFHGACFRHTLRVLNGGSLTKLSLRHTKLYGSDWRNILPLLSMPLLSEFNIWDPNIAFRDLSSFLLRHSSITHLDLSWSRPRGPIVPPKGFLPRLEIISGDPHYLLGLLSGRRHLFPHLRSVVLTYRLQQYEVLDNILQSLADRKRGTIRLSIEFWSPTGLTAWVFKARSKPWSFDCVKTIEIKFRFSPSSEMCYSVFSWVSTFPYVQEVDMTQVVPGDPNMCRTWRLNALWDSCPELQSITIGVKTYQRPVKAVTLYSS